MDTLLNLASAFGLSTSAGLNAYIPMLTVAVLARYTSLVQLEPPWDMLSNGWIIALLVVLLGIETFADKIPAIDTVNDVIQTGIRPTAGAIMFAATTQSSLHVHPVLAMACGVVLAGGVHAVKAGARPVLTATTGGVANPIVSTVEDAISTLTSLVAVIFPYLMLLWLIILVALVAYIIYRRHRRR